MQNYKTSTKKKRKFSESRARSKFIIHDTKSVIHKRKTDRFYLIKIKNFCSAKELLKEGKDKLQIGRKYLQTTHFTKD